MRRESLRVAVSMLLKGLVPLSIAWVGLILWRSWPDLMRNIDSLDWRWLAVTFAGASISAYLGFEVFFSIAYSVWQDKFDRSRMSQLYFTAQLMKHLPGRFWGIAYQSASADKATPLDWISVNAAYMLLSIAFAAWMVALCIASISSLVSGVCILISGIALYFGLWQTKPILAISNFFQHLPLRSLNSLGDAIKPFAIIAGRKKIRIFLLMLASWVSYCLAWGVGFGLAWPDLGIAKGVTLWGLYMVAWFAGYVTLITPSGLGVRELIFIGLAKEFAPDAVAAMAILGRGLLLMVDIFFALIYNLLLETRQSE